MRASREGTESRMRVMTPTRSPAQKPCSNTSGPASRESAYKIKKPVCYPFVDFRSVGYWLTLTCGADTFVCEEDDGTARTFEQHGGDFAEEELFSWERSHAHDQQVVASALELA
jgi:hypothetical protein